MKRVFSFLLCILLIIPVISKPASMSGTGFVDLLKMISDLEGLARIYSQNQPDCDAEELMLIYIRTGNKAYNDSLWNFLAGDACDDFLDFVERENRYLSKIRDIRSVTLPNGEITDFSHMFAAMNMIYKGYGDLGGWLGDICDLIYDIKDITGPGNTLISEAKTRLCNYGGFGAEDFRADLDAFNIMHFLDTGESISSGMSRYFTASLTNNDRCARFVKYRFGDEFLCLRAVKDEYIDIVSEIYGSDPMVGILEMARGISESDAHRKAACSAFAEHIFREAEEYMHDPGSNGCEAEEYMHDPGSNGCEAEPNNSFIYHTELNNGELRISGYAAEPIWVLTIAVKDNSIKPIRCRKAVKGWFDHELIMQQYTDYYCIIFENGLIPITKIICC